MTVNPRQLSLTAQIQCVERELAARRQEYPSRVSARRLRQGQADYEIAAMTAVRDTLVRLQHALPEIRELMEARKREETPER